MIEITLSTPLSRIVMPDKLRSRLNILKCRTFRDAMEADPDKWENVSPKVINAMKRFKKDYNDVYVNLFDADGNPISVLTSSSISKPIARVGSHGLKSMDTPFADKRFFVANNLLNAYVASGRMPEDKENLDVIMAKIMREADAFIKAFDMPNTSASPIDETIAEAEGEAVVSKPKRGRKPKSATEKTSSRKTSTSNEETRISPRTGKPVRKYNRKPADAKKKSKAKPKAATTDVELIKPGDVITITEYYGIKEPVYKKFRPGDKVTVTEVKVKRTGRIEAEGVMGDKVASFASDRYRWAIERDDSNNEVAK